MNRSAYLWIILALVVVVGVAYGISKYSSKKTTTSPSSTSTQTTPPASSTSQTDNSTAGSGSVAVVGGSNGPSCSSGGYFTPSSVTVKSGQTVTFSVPANDPYSGGLQIMGLPGGTIIIAPGSSKTTQPITSNVSFNATWPNNTACRKGSGTITVQ